MFNKFHALIQYSGQHFFGSSKQQNKILTVENILQRNIERIVNHGIKINSASRTDAGVHGVYSPITFEIRNTQMDKVNKIQKIINQSKEGFFIHELNQVPEMFDVKKNIISREYVYRIFIGGKKKELEDYFWFLKEDLDLNKMRMASKLFIGRRDFKLFSSKSNQVNSIFIQILFRIQMWTPFEKCSTLVSRKLNLKRVNLIFQN
jgi:tRNA pseudouridine38-40 synthase